MLLAEAAAKQSVKLYEMICLYFSINGIYNQDNDRSVSY